MYLDYLVPSWFEIESRITDEMGYQGRAQFRTYLNEPVASLALNLRRVRAVQSAFNQAEWQAGSILHQRFADLEIASILNELLKVVREMAMIVVGSTLTGGAIGAGIGAFGAGAGAIPLAGAGAAMGLKVSGWILGVLGLASIAEFFIEGLPRIGEYYLDGIRIAWEGQPNRPAGKDKEPSTGKPGSMPLHTVACFKADKLPVSKHGEFERQLKGQQDGLNRLTVEEFLENAANPIKRDPRAAKLARRRLQRDLEIRLHEELLETMSPHEAKVLAVRKAKETMSTLAALHNPDLIAGGKDVISDFGDRQVNSTIGPQWKSKVESLKRTVESAPKSDGKPTLLNVKLHKC